MTSKADSDQWERRPVQGKEFRDPRIKYNARQVRDHQRQLSASHSSARPTNLGKRGPTPTLCPVLAATSSASFGLFATNIGTSVCLEPTLAQIPNLAVTRHANIGITRCTLKGRRGGPDGAMKFATSGLPGDTRTTGVTRVQGSARGFGDGTQPDCWDYHLSNVVPSSSAGFWCLPNSDPQSSRGPVSADVALLCVVPTTWNDTMPNFLFLRQSRIGSLAEAHPILNMEH